MEKISFKTADGVAIVGNWTKVDGTRVALLLHMRPATKESWSTLEKILNEKSISTLSIDLRGHGESIQKDGEILNYQNYSEEEERESYNDIEAAAQFLTEKGFTKDKIVMAGASIGANLALWYAALNPEIKKVALLSPGLDYRGIQTLPLAVKLALHQEILIMTSSGDQRTGGDPVESANKIASQLLGKSEVKVQDSDLHGTDLFQGNTEFLETLAYWLAK